MNKKLKIKYTIIILTLMTVLTLPCVFYSHLQPKIINIFANRFDIVTNYNNMLVHFINVGQGDAIAINLPDDKIMLIDTGNEENNSSYISYLKENVVKTKKKNYIDYLVLSHADMDHVGGTLKLLKNFKIGTIFMPQIASQTPSYLEIFNYITNNCNYKTLEGESVIDGLNYQIKFFNVLNKTDTNESSQIVKVNCYNQSFLFVGDISSTLENEYINVYGSELDCDVLKISHHGSKTSTSKEFLQVVSPEYAVISVGEENNYGHPHDEVLHNLKECETVVKRTDIDNNILFASGAFYNLKVKTGQYYIVGLSLNYVGLVLIVDGLLIILCTAIILKKED